MIFNLALYGTLLCLSFYLQQARHEPVLATGPGGFTLTSADGTNWTRSQG